MRTAIIAFVCLVSLTFSQPCSPNLFSWAVLTNGVKNSSVVQLNPTLNTQTILPFPALPLTTSSLYDENDEQFVVSTGQNSLTTLNADSGGIDSVQYQPDSISVQASFASLVSDNAEDLIALGGVSDMCPNTPILRVDLNAGQASLEACIASDKYSNNVLSFDETHNVLYFATANQLIGVNLNNSQYFLQANVPTVQNVWSDYVNDRLYYTQGTSLFQYEKSGGRLVFDFSTVFSKTVGSFILTGASFDPKSQLMHGAYVNNDATGQTLSYFSFEIHSKKLLYQYKAGPTDPMFNYVRMGWICEDVSP